MVEDIRLPGHDVEQYRKFYQRPLADGADIDTWGVGHEKSPNSMHMTYMRHSPGGCRRIWRICRNTLSRILPMGECPSEGAGGCFKKQDLIAVGNMQTTIWETAWYLRGMENLFCDMMAEEGYRGIPSG